MTTPSYTYIGRKACGCVVFAMVETPPYPSEEGCTHYKRDLARELGGCIRSGLTVERVSTEEARNLIRSCPHQVKKSGKKAALL